MQAISELQRRLESTPQEDRADVIDAASRMSETARNTIYRQLRAFRFVALAAKAEGIPTDTLRATLLSIERFRRIERHNPTLAASLRRKVLLGEITQAALADLVPPSRRTRLSEWEATAVELAERFPGRVRSITLRDSSGLTAPGTVLRVDIEVELDASETGAIFISPSAIYSKVGTFSEQVGWIIASFNYYDYTMVCCEEEDYTQLLEIISVMKFEDTSCREGESKLIREKVGDHF